MYLYVYDFKVFFIWLCCYVFVSSCAYVFLFGCVRLVFCVRCVCDVLRCVFPCVFMWCSLFVCLSFLFLFCVFLLMFPCVLNVAYFLFVVCS